MGILQLFKMAFGSIASNKLRSFLTMLGIIIGISSVIILIGIGQGAKKQVADQIESLGTNLITVNLTGNRYKAVTNKELEELKSKPGIKNIAPTIIANNISIKAGDKTAVTNLEATVPEYTEIRNTQTQFGRFIAQSDLDKRYRVALIGVDLADGLFNSRQVVGKNVTISGIDFKIIGLLQEQGSTSNGSNDDKIIIPLTVAQRLLKTTAVKTFYVEASGPDSVDEAMTYLQLFLLKKYCNDSNSFKIFNQTSLLDTANTTNQNMTLMLSGIAGISLLVGGIGIMNIMLISIMERTREIGIRKAIGAKRRSILAQFLIEAVMVSGVGGILGVLMGYLGGELLKRLGRMAVLISPSVVLLAFCFSVTVGIIFGLYPANKASRLNPIDALRYE